MTTTSVQNENGIELGYYFWSPLSPNTITAVKADGSRATTQGMSQAEMWIRS